MPALLNPDDEVLQAIQRVRDKIGCCSYQLLGDELGGVHRATMQRRCQGLIERGLVLFTEGVTGSVRLTAAGELAAGIEPSGRFSFTLDVVITPAGVSATLEPLPIT